MPERIERILIDRTHIAARVREMGRELSSQIQAELAREGADPAAHADRVVLMPILTGSIVFTADLIREMPVKLSMRVVAVSSYPGTATASKGALLRGVMPPDLAGRHVIVLDDILDSGQTLAMIRDLVMEQKPASLRIVVLLDKKARRVSDVRADLVGFDIPDEFVVGYGLDYDGYYRNLPDVAVLHVS